jgi:hypothetical protein
MRVLLFFVFLAVGVVLGILYNKFRVKNYPEDKRKSGYFLAITMFVGASLSIFIITTISSCLNSTITNFSGTIEKYFDEKYSDNEIVTNGISINQLNEILVHTSSGKDMIASILPSGNELGAGKFVYGIIVDYAGEYIDTYVSSIKQGVSSTMDKYADTISVFTDKNGNITVSSIIGGLRYNLLNKINRVLLTILIIANIPLYIYITVTTILAIKAYRKNKNAT